MVELTRCIKTSLFYLSYLLIASFGFELQNRYQIVPENYTLKYIDYNYVDMSFGIRKINGTNAIWGNFKSKIDLPEDTRMFVKGLKWLNDNYSLHVLQFDKTMKDFIEMELFDLQTLFVHEARPPIIWPIKKNVVYRAPGWIPDSTKYPPNLPNGKWQVEITQALANKTKIIVAYWYFNIKYSK